MRERRDGLRLTHEPLTEGGLLGEIGLEGFHRHAAAQALVPALIDDAHAARPNQGANLVGAHTLRHRFAGGSRRKRFSRLGSPQPLRGIRGGQRGRQRLPAGGAQALAACWQLCILDGAAVGTGHSAASPRVRDRDRGKRPCGVREDAAQKEFRRSGGEVNEAGRFSRGRSL
jgi:hypothetical protein